MTTSAPATVEKGLGADAWVVTTWTLVSRITGFVRIAVAGAILGPTILSNVYQATTVLPTVAYNLMAGSLVVSLVVPAIGGHLDVGDTRKASKLAGSFLGVIVTAALAMAALILVARPVVGRLLTLGADEDLGADSRRISSYLLVLVVPQVALFGLASVGMAAQNACQRFAMAAAAPAVENAVVIVSLVVFAFSGGGGLDADSVTPFQLVILGVGSTAAVAVHAALQWWGAASAGIVLVPRFQWRDPELRAMVRQSGPAMATAMAQSIIYFVLIVGAGTVAGGVIAFQLASQTMQLPVALGARPVAVALLPRLSQRWREKSSQRFVVEYSEGLWLTGVTAVPAAVGLVVFFPYIASTISVGRMSADSAVALVEVALIALALSVLGVSLAEVGRVALFAQGDFKTAAVAAWIRVAIVFVGVGAATFLTDPILVIATLGVAATVGELWSGGLIQRRAIRDMRARGLLATSMTATMVIAIGSLGIAGVVARLLSRAGIADPFVLVICGAGGMGLYAGLQYRFAPEFRRLSRGALSSSARIGQLLRGDVGVVLGGIGLMVVFSVAAAFIGWLAPLALAGLAVAAAVWVKPALAVYLYVGTLPFLAGMERGALLPEVRPNEAVLFGLIGLLLVRGFWTMLLGGRLQLRPARLDLAVIVFTMFGSVVPIVIMVARGLTPELGDLLEPLVLWRLMALYILVRATIHRVEQLRRVLIISLSVSAVVAVVAVAQGVGLLGSGGEALLVTLWGPEDVLNTGRASATLASSIATGAYLAYSLGIAVAWWGMSSRMPELGGRRAIPPLVLLLLLGGLAAGQFSSWLAVLIAGFIAARYVGKLRLVVRWGSPLIPVAAVVTWPVLSGRLSEFTGPFGMPRSWIGRIDNLSNFYIPPLIDNFGFVLGVRPNSILEAPEQWREEIFLESGYLWLLWVGGIPFLIAFTWMMVEAGRASLAAARLGATTGIVGAAAVAAVVCVMVMTILDKHLQLRGAGDLLFVLLPMTLVGVRFRQAGLASSQQPMASTA